MPAGHMKATPPQNKHYGVCEIASETECWLGAGAAGPLSRATKIEQRGQDNLHQPGTFLGQSLFAADSTLTISTECGIVSVRTVWNALLSLDGRGLRSRASDTHTHTSIQRNTGMGGLPGASRVSWCRNTSRYLPSAAAVPMRMPLSIDNQA